MRSLCFRREASISLIKVVGVPAFHCFSFTAFQKLWPGPGHSSQTHDVSSATRTSQVALRSPSGGNEPAATFCEPVAHGFRPSRPPSNSMRSPAAFQQQSTWYSESAFQTHSRWRVPGYLIPPARCWSRGAIVRRDFQTSFWPPLVCLLSGIIATNR
jgi:hypothetical protein